MADQSSDAQNQIAAKIESNLEISFAAMQKYLNATQKCAGVSQKINAASNSLVAAMSGKIDFGVNVDVKKSFQKYIESNQKISGASKGILEALSGNIDFGLSLDLKKSLQKYNDLNKNIKGSSKGLLEAVSGSFDFGMNFDFKKIFQKKSGLSGMLAGGLKVGLDLASGSQKDSKANPVSKGLSIAGGLFAGMMGSQNNDPIQGMTGKWSKFTPIIAGVSSALKDNKEAMLAVNTAEKAGMIVNALSQGWGSASGALKLMQNGNSMAASAQVVLNSSMLACPVTWIVAGIIGLVAAGYLLIKNWGQVKVFLTNLWTSIKTTFSNALNFIWKLFDNKYIQGALAVFVPFIGLPILVIKNWDKIKTFFSGLWNGIKSGFTAAVNWISNLVLGLWNKLKAVFDAVGGFFAKIFGSKNSHATLEVQSASKTANAKIPKHAMGTSNHPGGLAIVGEEGPELVHMPGNSQVYSNSRTKSLLNGMGGGNSGISINYSPQITIQGNADAKVMKTASDQSYADFERKFNALMDRRRRLSFAGG